MMPQPLKAAGAQALPGAIPVGRFFISIERGQVMAKGKYLEWIEPDGLLRLKGLAREYTDQEIAKKIGVRAATISEWKARFPQIAEVFKEARKPVAVEIEDSFLSRCQWKMVTETETKFWIGKDGQEHSSRIERTKWFPPDTACLIYALKNHLPQRYVDKPVDRSQNTQKAHADIVSAIKAIAEED